MTKHISFLYYRNASSPFTVAYTYDKLTGESTYGVSFCNKCEKQFVKKIGRDLAEKRLLENPVTLWLRSYLIREELHHQIIKSIQQSETSPRRLRIGPRRFEPTVQDAFYAGILSKAFQNAIDGKITMKNAFDLWYAKT